jgi:hypothetical protein
VHKRWRPPRVGRRGCFLAFLALLAVLYGYSFFAYTSELRLDLLLPARVWGVLWLAVGVVCATGIFTRRDRLQFTTATGMQAGWGALWCHLWLVQHVTGAWVSAVVWIAFAVLTIVVAGWPEQPPPPRFPAPPAIRIPPAGR